MHSTDKQCCATEALNVGVSMPRCSCDGNKRAEVVVVEVEGEDEDEEGGGRCESGS